MAAGYQHIRVPACTTGKARAGVFAIGLGATATVPPQDAMGVRWAIVTDPQGASFGLVKNTSPQS